MKIENSDIKLSHIILYVDKYAEKCDICAIRTKLSDFSKKIRFTYLYYGNHELDINEVSHSLFEATSQDEKGTNIVLTDRTEISEISISAGIPVIGILNENKPQDFSKVKYLIEDLNEVSLIVIENIWKRYNNIPWIIGETKRLVIRELSVDDVDRLYEIYNDKMVTDNTESLYNNPEDEKAYMQDYIKYQYGFYEYGVWGLFEKSTGLLIGRAGLSQREGFEDPELGYVIAKEQRGKQYAKEACNFIIEYAKSELQMSRVNAFCLSTNQPSIRLLKSMGFEYIGEYSINGGIHSYYTLSMW